MVEPKWEILPKVKYVKIIDRIENPGAVMAGEGEFKEEDMEDAPRGSSEREYELIDFGSLK